LFRDADAVLDWHPGDRNSVTLGSNLANTRGLFRFHGIAAHAAVAPHRGRSALDGALIMVHAVDLMREHVPQETRIHYIIPKGGSAVNIVPASAEVFLLARHPEADELDRVWSRIMKCAEGAATASETRLDFEQGVSLSNRLQNEVLAEVLSEAMQKAGGYRYTPEEKAFATEIRKSLDSTGKRLGPEIVLTDKSTPLGMSSSDAGDVSWNVPLAQLTAATFVSGVAPHTWQAMACAGASIGRKGMLVAARTLALAAVQLFEYPEKVRAAREAFVKQLAGRKWTTRIPADAKPRLTGATLNLP
jgi:aminobenzoyl-glutamate utilization protein B